MQDLLECAGADVRQLEAEAMGDEEAGVKNGSYQNELDARRRMFAIMRVMIDREDWREAGDDVAHARNAELRKWAEAKI